jgi:hypothetical protein
LIRHARLHAALTILPLPVAVIEPPFRALLMSAVGAPPLMEPSLAPATEAAVALTAITVGTEKKDRAAFAAAANPSPQDRFAGNRHAPSRAGLDKRYSYVAL